MEKIFVIGSGAVGTSIANALQEAGSEIIGIYDIDTRTARNAAELIGVQGFGGALPLVIKEAGNVLVTVPDHVIPQVVALAQAEELYNENQIWLHCSGHLTADVFEPLKNKIRGCATMHPAFVFPPKECTAIPGGVFYAVGGDGAGIEKATEYVTLLGGKLIHVEPEMRPAYHAAMVMGSNYIVTMLACARDVLLYAGIQEDQIENLLFSLSQSAINRSKKLGIGHSLSGPVRRGDVTVVKDHLVALSPEKELKKIYAEVGKATVKLAASQEGYCQDTALTLLGLLEKE